MKFLLLLLLAGNFFSSCAKDKDKGDGEVEGKKGFITGKVLNTKGEPLSGVQVTASHMSLFNANVIGVTNAQGVYSLDMTTQPGGNWRLLAKNTVTYNGKTYIMEIHPDNTEPISTPTTGLVRNMNWKLSGVIPGSTTDSRMGTYLTFFSGVDVPEEELEFSLEPVGPLVDGSTGTTIVRRASLFPTSFIGMYSNRGVRDIPTGRYKISVRHVPPAGSPVKVIKIAARGTGSTVGYHTNVTIDPTQDPVYTNYTELELDLMEG